MNTNSLPLPPAPVAPPARQQLYESIAWSVRLEPTFSRPASLPPIKPGQQPPQSEPPAMLAALYKYFELTFWAVFTGLLEQLTWFHQLAAWSLDALHGNSRTRVLGLSILTGALGFSAGILLGWLSGWGY